MDQKFAWAFCGGIFIAMALYQFGEKDACLYLVITLGILSIVTLYKEFKKMYPQKPDPEQKKWEKLGLTKDGQYPILDISHSSPNVKLYSIPLGLGLQDFLNKQTQLEAFFDHYIALNVRYGFGKPLLEITFK